MQQSKEDIVQLLGLIPHPDYGFFRETYRSGATPMASRGQTDPSGDVFPAARITGPSEKFWQGKSKAGGEPGMPRNIMTSIYFMVTAEKPYMAIHVNEADCMHYWQGGGRLEYMTVTPDGTLQKTVLGPNIVAGDTMQFLCPGGGYMKACRLLDDAEYCLIGEAVAPGFDVAGHHYVTTAELKAAVTSEEFDELSGLLRAQDDPTLFDTYYD